MTDESDPPKNEHELIVTTSPSMTASRGQRASHSEDLLIACVCGWKYLAASESRGARRAFDRHLRKVATGKVDRGDAGSRGPA